MTKTFDHMLVPYNGTTGRQKGFRKAVALAQVTKAKITINTCLEKRPVFGFFKTKTSRQESEKECKSVQKQHNELKEFAGEHNVVFDSKVVKNGMASIKILQFTKQHDIDLTLMAKKKISSHYEKMHYQSAIENMFRNTHCPVLIL